MVLAAAVTISDLLLAFPLSYYAARMASDRVRNALLFAVVMPLWANYLVKVFAWKTMLAGSGPVDALFGLFGWHPGFATSLIAVWITLSYLWLPYVILPMSRPSSACRPAPSRRRAISGARSGRTFRKIVLPLVFPGLVAASIFSFSLTLGDYITVELIGKSVLLGNTIDAYAGGTANDQPLAAALATIPIVIMGVYLLIARALGAFEAL